MFTKRIIPCLDVHGGRVVKGVNFVNLKDAGDPVEIAAAYDQAGADEVVFLDITASSDARATVVDMVRRVAEKVFIPFTVGGGIRTVDDFRALLREGADKVSVNSAAIMRPELICEAADKFGSQCVVVAIDAKRRADGSGWNIYKNGGRVDMGIDALNPLEVKAGVDSLELKKKFGDKLCLFGGLDALHWHDPDFAVSEIRRVVPVLKQNGGYICSSDHSIPNDVSLENYRTIVQAMKECGRY